MLEEMGMKPTAKDVRRMFRKYDEDGSGSQHFVTLSLSPPVAFSPLYVCRPLCCLPSTNGERVLQARLTMKSSSSYLRITKRS